MGDLRSVVVAAGGLVIGGVALVFWAIGTLEGPRSNKKPATSPEHDLPVRHADPVPARALPVPVPDVVRHPPLADKSEAAVQATNAPAVDRMSDDAQAESEPAAMTEDERLAYASSVFDSEVFDAAWARNASASLESGLHALLGTSGTLREVECRTSLCRVVLRHDSGAVQRDFLLRFRRSQVWQGSGTVIYGQPDSKGQVVATLYLARPGAELPIPTE